MYKTRSIVGYILTGIMVIFLISGCALLEEDLSITDWIFGNDDEKNPAELMSDGIANLEKGRYDAASEAFQKIKDRYPYSKYAISAELKMADALYKQDEFIQAFEAYDEFERLHPRNRNIPYVIYQKGMCHLEQVKSTDRNQADTFKARTEFERLVKKFPRENYTNMARKKLRKCLIYLAEYELYVGHYYYKMGKYKAALDRYSYIIKNYPDMGQYNEAIDYIGKCKLKLSKKDK